jgi:hypothetical protein
MVIETQRTSAAATPSSYARGAVALALGSCRHWHIWLETWAAVEIQDAARESAKTGKKVMLPAKP